jgi:hypothetical protein
MLIIGLYTMSNKKVNTSKAHENYPDGLRIVARLIAKKYLENTSTKEDVRIEEDKSKNLYRAKGHSST